MISGKGMLDGQSTGPAVAGAVMEGFAGWLAGQRVPLSRRRAVYREVEQFLAWQRNEFPGDAPVRRPAVWCYLLNRQRDGDGEDVVLRVWGALELLLNYTDGLRPP